MEADRIPGNEGVSDDWVKNTDKFNLQPYLDMMNSDIVFRPHSRSTLVWWNMMTTELKEAWSGNQEMDTVCNTIAEKMDQMPADE